MNKCTIKDIAKIAGVSQATVSSVINNTGHCSAETEAHIRMLMIKHNYNPRPYKGRGKHKVNIKSKIGFLINSLDPTLFSSPNVSKVIGAIQHILKPKNFEIIPLTYGPKVNLKKVIISQKIKGLIVFEDQNSRFSTDIFDINCPIVSYSQERRLSNNIDILTSNPVTYSSWITEEITSNNYNNVCCFLSEQEDATSKYTRLILEEFFKKNNINYTNIKPESPEIKDLLNSTTEHNYETFIIFEFNNYLNFIIHDKIKELLQNKANLFMSYKQELPDNLDIPFKGLHVNFVETGNALARMILWRLEFPGMPPQVNLVSPLHIK